jgi:hypothetical protein
LRAGATGRHLHAGAYETVIYQLATKLLEANAEVQLLRVGLVASMEGALRLGKFHSLRGCQCWNGPALGSESKVSVTVPGRRCQPVSEWEPASEAAG